MKDRIFRPMRSDDLEAVLALETLCHQSPWSRRMFLDELANDLSSIDLLWVREILAGFHCYWSFGGEMHVLNLVTAPGFRRRGFATLLLTHAIGGQFHRGLERVFLEVRTGNSPAIALYQSLGFASIGFRKEYYPDGEDALVMALEGERLKEFGRRLRLSSEK